MHELAIVIPAYRTRFLQAALTSLAAQTDQAFTVYVGDDASPDDVQALCAAWADKLDLRYTRFDTNVGGQDLVAQWTRCIALSHEPWVWLFSDDDELEPGCVQAWREATGRQPQADLFHFDVLRIDAQGQPLHDEPAFPARLSSRGFLQSRLLFKLASYAPDYVFRRSALQAVGGFQTFPLAWCSDDATWVKLAALGGGVQAVRGPRVRWRLSGSNISSQTNVHLAQAKIEAWLQFLEWLDAQVSALPREAGDADDLTLLRHARYWFYQQVRHVGLPFRRLRWWALARRLGRLQQHSAAGAVLRMLQSDWRSRRRPPG